MQKENITYEYKDITVSRKLELRWEDGYDKFGWELVKSAPAKVKPVWGPLKVMLAPLAVFPGMPFRNMVNGHESADRVEMRWKRKRDKQKENRNELNRLQERFETVMGELEYKERMKGLSAYMAGTACGLIGAVFLALSLFAYGMPAVHVGFAIPGILSWIVGAVLYFFLKEKGKKTAEKELEEKTETMDDICEQASALL
ncbi:MAG: hypothetical protein Q4D90_11725 [bacterium]|nr:hypothetical protein [bacterium]